MSNKIFGFCAQKLIGTKGEDDFYNYYKDIFNLTRLDGRKCDFMVGEYGAELKTDNFPLDKTKNLFIETISNHKNKKKGGVYRALTDGADFFIYYFTNGKTFFWYRTKDLCEYLKKNIHRFEKKIIRNHGYTSEGRLVPRDRIKKFLFRKDTF